MMQRSSLPFSSPTTGFNVPIHQATPQRAYRLPTSTLPSSILPTSHKTFAHQPEITFGKEGGTKITIPGLLVILGIIFGAWNHETILKAWLNASPVTTENQTTLDGTDPKTEHNANVAQASVPSKPKSSSGGDDFLNSIYTLDSKTPPKTPSTSTERNTGSDLSQTGDGDKPKIRNGASQGASPSTPPSASQGASSANSSPFTQNQIDAINATTDRLFGTRPKVSHYKPLALAILTAAANHQRSFIAPSKSTSAYAISKILNHYAEYKEAVGNTDVWLFNICPMSTDQINALNPNSLYKGDLNVKTGQKVVFCRQ